MNEGAWTDSQSPEETMEMGRRLGALLKSGDTVSLVGEIGSGKTTFTKGVARGLGIRVDLSEVTSPTFVLMKEYPCRVPLYHIDLYRLDEARGVDAGLIQECFASEGVTVLEWGSRAESILPPDHLEVEFEHGGPTSRRIRFRRIGSFRELAA